jgi:polyisoprenoid-binding protein YceI
MTVQTQEITIDIGDEQIVQSARQAWSIVTGSEKLAWSARKKYFMLLPITATGTFSEVAGEIIMQDDDPESVHAIISIAVASLNSGQPKRDKHLLTADFFDADNHPSITFESTRIQPVTSTGGAYHVSGLLTARGQTRPITLDATFEFMPGNSRAHVTMKGSINRREFGMTWSAVPLMKLFDEIELSVAVDIERA